MEEKEQQMLLLAQALPAVAAQLRATLANMHAALSAGDEPGACILRQSYYRMLRTVTNLTDAAMLADDTPLPKQDVDLVILVDELCRQAQPLAEACGLTLRVDIRPRHLVVGINPTYTQRLLWNLLSNAMKFTPPGGTIEVSLRTGPECVLLCVKDSGPGIPQDKLERLFDRWQHSNMDLPVHGLGLGLPLCRRIAQGHGGSLVVSSRKGEGTAVTVRLPDRRSGVTLVRQPLFHYTGGFNPVLVELADALPVQAFTRNYID